MRDLIIAVDESLSCAATVNATYVAALAIAGKMGNRASVIVHSNGYHLRVPDGAPCAHWLRREIKSRSRALERHYYAASQRAASHEIWDAIAKRRPGLVLAIGDLDAADELDLLAGAGAHVMLLAHHQPQPGFKFQILGPVVDLKSAADVLETQL